jgi:hypothetical protein
MALFTNVNAGRVRILMGSTEKMGAGTNAQRRLKALHHIDAPWRPRDIEQRDGRILRQGNLNSEIDIYRYVTEGSFDAYMWQTLETKAIASGNPAVMEKVKVDTEIRKLDQLRAAHLNQQHNIRWQIRNLPEKIAEAHRTLAAVREDIATRDAHEGGEFSMLVGTKDSRGKARARTPPRR